MCKCHSKLIFVIVHDVGLHANYIIYEMFSLYDEISRATLTSVIHEMENIVYILNISEFGIIMTT